MNNDGLNEKQSDNGKADKLQDKYNYFNPDVKPHAMNILQMMVYK